MDIHKDCTSFLPNGRTEIKSMFAVAALVLTAFFLIPLPNKLLDILWICLFCLAGAIAVICAAAKNSFELIGFTALVRGVILLLVAVQSSTARCIIEDRQAGVLFSWAEAALSFSQPLAILMVCLFLSMAAVFAIFVFSQKIVLSSTTYFRRVLPLKQMGIETDLRLGAVDEKQALVLAGRVLLESRFFAGMHSSAVLMRTAGAVGIFILLACLLVPVYSARHYPAAVMGFVPDAAALSGFSILPLLTMAAACGFLAGKNSLMMRLNGAEATISAIQTNLVGPGSESDMRPSAIQPPPVKQPIEEHIVEFEPQEPAVIGSNPVWPATPCRDPKAYYQQLVKLIGKGNTQPRLIGLVSQSPGTLPITVAVNAAIGLAQQKRRILLADTDNQRNAAARVFDMEPELIQRKIVPSGLDNLWVCCVPPPKLNAFLGKTDLLGHFDTILFYMPQAHTLDRIETDQPIMGVFYFTADETAGIGLQDIQMPAFCHWICPVPSLQSVLSKQSPRKREG